MTAPKTPRAPRTKKPAPAADIPAVAPQVLPRGSVAPVLPAPFTPPAPFVKKKPSWS